MGSVMSFKKCETTIKTRKPSLCYTFHTARGKLCPTKRQEWYNQPHADSFSLSSLFWALYPGQNRTPTSLTDSSGSRLHVCEWEHGEKRISDRVQITRKPPWFRPMNASSNHERPIVINSHCFMRRIKGQNVTRIRYITSHFRWYKTKKNEDAPPFHHSRDRQPPT